MNKDDLTIILQGPLHEVGLRNISTYLQYGRVIISSWNYCDTKLLSLLGDNFNKVTILLNNKERDVKNYDRNGPVDNDGNVYWQCLSTYNAIKLVETRYVMKVRCDESFSDLSEFVKMLETNKIVVSNRFARTRNQPFHIGDTYFGGQTLKLYGAFLRLKLMLEAKDFHMLNVCGSSRILSAEQKIGISVILSTDPGNKLQECVDTMKNNFLICPLSSMGSFLVNSSGWAKDGLPNPRAEFNPGEWGCISDINQV